MGRLDVKAFFKTMDTHSLLHRGSHHNTNKWAGWSKCLGMGGRYPTSLGPLEQHAE